MIEQIKIEVRQAVKELHSLEDISFSVDFPSDMQFGDYACNVAMILAKQLKKNPKDIANDLTGYIKVHSPQNFTSTFSKIETVGGFINFTVSSLSLWNIVQQRQKAVLTSSGKGKKITVEYGQPNTHKLPHIGHLFSYLVGESLARLLESTGNTVTRANYQGDIGPHVSKSLYGYIQVGQPKPETLLEKVQLLQKCYQEGTKAYEEDPLAKETIDAITKKLYTKDPEIFEMWKETRQWSIDYYFALEKRLNVQQTYHYMESEIWNIGKEIVEKNIGTIFESSDGAIIFAGEKYGLHTRVFLTKNNTPTYEAKDMGLNIQKYQDLPYDLNLITTASEQNAYFDVMIKALELCWPELVGKTKHIGFGMVSMSTGKMSSRTGQILSAVDLIEAVKQRVVEVMKDREGLTAEEKESITEKVTMGAIKFAFLRQNVLQNMKFDLEESIKFEGRSGPYLQYTYARIQSILKQLDLPEATSKDGEQLTKQEELYLMRWITRFPSILSRAAEALSPHIIAEFVYQSAQLFNSFYAQCPINAEKNKELQRARRTLAVKTAAVIKEGLGLLGIEVVAKM